MKFNEAVKQYTEGLGDHDKLYVEKQGNTLTLWVSYSPGSGTTSVFKKNEFPKAYLTTKTGDKNYDDIVRPIAKNFPEKKVIEVPMYEYNTKTREYSVWDGPIKPIKMYYAVLTSEQNYHIVGFFDNKNEAKYWTTMNDIADKYKK